MTERILALDPGGTTGWAFWETGDKFTVGHMTGAHHLELYNFMGHLQVQSFTVVCESFEFRQHDDFRTGVVLDSKEYIGVVKLFEQERMQGLVDNKVVFQTAGQAKGFIPDKAKNGLPANAKLKAIGQYYPNMKHANDAMRHLITYLVQKRGRHDLVKAWRDL